MHTACDHGDVLDASRTVGVMTSDAVLERVEHEARVFLVVHRDHEGPIVFTCSDCEYRYVCDFAFDEWNLNGDCIMDK